MDLLKTCRASTLLETICAILIITVVFGVGLSIYQNVVSSTRSGIRHRAWIYAGEELHKADVHADSEPVKTEDGLIIIRTIQPLTTIEKLYILTVVVQNQDGKELARRERIIEADES